MQDGLLTTHIRDYDLPFIKFGDGEKVLLNIPGLSYVMMPAQVERRKKQSVNYPDFTSYYVERRPNLTTGYSTREMAQDVFDFIDTLGLGKVYVHSVSQGGMIAQWLAIDHPEVVKALVLTVTLSRPNDTIKETRNWLELLKKGDAKEALRYMRDGSYSQKWIDEHGDEGLEVPPADARRPLDQYEILEEACQTHNAYPGLSNIKCPVLVNGGWKDGVVSGEASMEIAEKLHCDLHMDALLGHGLYEEDPFYHARVNSWLLEH